MSRRKDPHWVAARQAPPRADQSPKMLRRQLPAEHSLHCATVSGIRALRLSVWPPESQLPSSLALDPARTIDWRSARQARLPFGVRWQRQAEARFQIRFPLGPKARCLGLGERYQGLQRRGRVHTLFATDDHIHIESVDPLYKSIGWLVVADGTEHYGILLDSPAPQRWDLDSSRVGKATITLLTRRGWQLTLLGPASMPELVAAMTTLTGRAALPPRWSLGHCQSRWSYPSESVVRQIAAQFRARRIPCDSICLDIDYMKDYRVFTIDRSRFRGFESMVQDLRRDGMRLVPICDPGIVRSTSDATYCDGRSHDVFCRRSNGSVFVGKVWAGPSVLPDFTREEVRAWWGRRLRFLTSKGVAGIWADMNEPALFDHKRPLALDSDELPPEDQQLFMQQAPEGTVGHFELHNAYGMQMAQACWESLEQSRPNERPFVLTRSTYTGGQRYGAVWLGDNMSWFEHLRHSIPMLLSAGLSGLAFSGVDVGGFGNDCDAELLARWYQLGIFYPYFRNHCAMGGRAQEPWAYGPEIERAVRRLIRTRYRLIPYLEGLFAEHRETGAPLMRPLFWHYPDDPRLSEIDDQFLLGPDLLVAPILYRGTTTRTVVLPKGRWYPFDGGPALSGGRLHQVSFDLEAVPALVRHGAILPLVDPAAHTGLLDRAPLTFRVYGSRARGRFWQDDGQSRSYEQGTFNDWALNYQQGKLTIRARHLGYAPQKRRYFVAAEGQRRAVSLPG